jgi:hypothetical protein
VDEPDPSHTKPPPTAGSEGRGKFSLGSLAVLALLGLTGAWYYKDEHDRAIRDHGRAIEFNNRGADSHKKRSMTGPLKRTTRPSDSIQQMPVCSLTVAWFGPP